MHIKAPNSIRASAKSPFLLVLNKFTLSIVVILNNLDKTLFTLPSITGILLFNPIEKNADKIVKNTSWVKVSINAGTRDTYSQIHTTKKEDFDIVLQNMKLAVKTKNPDDIQLSNKLSEIIKDQRSRFERSSEVFSISGAVLAIGYKN